MGETFRLGYDRLECCVKDCIESPKISVIIPIYNAEKHLTQCLDSLIFQTLKELEFICVDNGSTDNSLEILEKYAKDDARFIIFSQEKQEEEIIENKGVEIAKGEYIVFLKSNNSIEVNALEKIYEYFKETYINIANFDCKKLDKQSLEYNKLLKKIKPNNSFRDYVFSIKDKTMFGTKHKIITILGLQFMFKIK